MTKKIHWNLKSYTEQQFREAWASATSINDVARRLGLQVSGGSSTTLRTLGEELGLSTEHFRRTTTRPFTLEEILVEHTPLLSNDGLRRRLTVAGLKEEKCESCGITEWMGQPAPLQLDHINGNNRDNRLENLRVLCANCHMLTDTWCGKDRVRRAGNGLLPGESRPQQYCSCGQPMQFSSKQCKDCAPTRKDQPSQERTTYPATEELIAGVETYGYLAYGKSINLSDNGLRKLLRRRGVHPLPAAKHKKPFATKLESDTPKVA